MLFDLSNLPYWIFLGMGVLLYVFVIVSGGGDDDLDLDADADLDVDADLDGDGNPFDLDTDADADGNFSAAQVLGWLGIGKAPLILLLATDLSLWGVLGWMLNVALSGNVFLGLFVLIGSLIAALVLGGFIARPIGSAFASFGEDASSDRLIGCVGTVSTALIPVVHENKIGQVDVLDAARNLVTVNAVLPEWATTIPARGSKVLVIDRTLHLYLVIAKDSPDQDQWLANPSRLKDSH